MHAGMPLLGRWHWPASAELPHKWSSGLHCTRHLLRGDHPAPSCLEFWPLQRSCWHPIRQPLHLMHVQPARGCRAASKAGTAAQVPLSTPTCMLSSWSLPAAGSWAGARSGGARASGWARPDHSQLLFQKRPHHPTAWTPGQQTSTCRMAAASRVPTCLPLLRAGRTWLSLPTRQNA